MVFLFLYYAFKPVKKVVEPVKTDPTCWDTVETPATKSISKDMKVSDIKKLAKKN